MSPDDSTNTKDRTVSNFLVWQKGKRFRTLNGFEAIIAGLSIYSMIIPVALLDLMLLQYQAIYFRLSKIPRIRRRDYVIVDRYELDGLTFFQKFDCMYCGYVNGVISFAMAVANQTEVYSCAIRHRIKPKGQSHQKNFYNRTTFTSDIKH